MDLRLLSSGPVASFHPSPHHHPHHQHPFHHQSLDNHLYSDPGLFPGYSYDHHHHPMNHGNIYNGTVNWTPQASSCDVNSHYIPSETPPTPVTTITASATYCVPCSPRSSSSTNQTTESPGLYHNSELIKSGPNCDYYNPSPSSTGSTNFLTPSPPSYSNGLVVNTANPPTTPTSATPCLTENETDLAVVGLRQPKKRNTANKKERKRTVSINTAFSLLRDHIPNVPTDTKLSKIKTLRLATNYISYLMKLLDQSNSPNMSAAGGKVPLTCEDFKVDLQRFKGIKSENDLTSLKMTSTVKDRCSISEGSKRGKGRTGWPQHVWALELKREHTET